MDAETIAIRLKHLIDAGTDEAAAKAASWALVTDLGSELPANRSQFLRQFRAAVIAELRWLEKQSDGRLSYQIATLRAVLHLCEAYDVRITPVVQRRAAIHIDAMNKARLAILKELAVQSLDLTRLAASLQLPRAVVQRSISNLREDRLISRIRPCSGRKPQYMITKVGRERLRHRDAAHESGPDSEADPEPTGRNRAIVQAALRQLVEHIPITQQAGLLVKGYAGWGAKIARELPYTSLGRGRRQLFPVYGRLTNYANWGEVCCGLAREVNEIRKGGMGSPVVFLDDFAFADIIQFPSINADNQEVLPRAKVSSEFHEINRDLNLGFIRNYVPVVYFIGWADFDFPKEIFDAPKWKILRPADGRLYRPLEFPLDLDGGGPEAAVRPVVPTQRPYRRHLPKRVATTLPLVMVQLAASD